MESTSESGCLRVDGKRHACKLPPPSCVGIVNDFNSGLKPKARIDGKFLDDKDYRNHKYLLNLPGAASGSYSKNLNHLWRTGSVVMQWVHPFVEWYRLSVFVELQRDVVAAMGSS